MSLALLESALWAGLVYLVLNVSPFMPAGWQPLGHLLLGTALFALGSYVNRACVFGSVGHFGNGNIGFSLVFVGLFIATRIGPLAGVIPKQPPVTLAMPASAFVIIVVGLPLLIWARHIATRNGERNFRRLSLAMPVLALAFTLLAISTPLFSITASLETIYSVPVAGAVAVIGISLGSLTSGYVRKREFRIRWPTWRSALRRLSGGLLMGLGTLLIPGGNDTLLLVGLPAGAWQALISYVLLVVILSVLIKAFGTRTRAWV